MAQHLSAEQIGDLLDALCGSYDVSFPFGELRLLSRSLPGKAVAAVLPDVGDGVLRVVYDTSKPNAFGHTQAMIREWWESYREPVAFPDGTVELLNRVLPEPGVGPVRVALVPRGVV